MKKFLIPFVCAILCYFPQTISAQAIPADSVFVIALSHINSILTSVHRPPKSMADYNVTFYIEDLATRKLFAGEKNGIYEFAVFGDDVPRWIMWQDSTGYKVYDVGHRMDLQMLGEILEFCKRNNYSPEQSFRYIEGVYNSLYLMSISFQYEIEP